MTAGVECRTLTPFGFQAEERTLWEATETYINMSPYLQAHKIQKPLLLIHGEDDNNAGLLKLGLFPLRQSACSVMECLATACPLWICNHASA